MSALLDDPVHDEAAPAYCRGCGYDLRTLAAGRCPECGRAFDPADPRTVHARPPGSWSRAMLRPPAAAAWAALAAAGLALLLAVTPPAMLRLPAAWPGAWHYLNKLARPAEVVALHPAERAYLGGLVLTLLAGGGLAIRAGLTLLAMACLDDRPRGGRWRWALAAAAVMMLLASGTVLIAGREARLATFRIEGLPATTCGLTAAEDRAALLLAAEKRTRPLDRTTALKLLVEGPGAGTADLMRLADGERDEAALQALLYTIGLCRDATCAAWMERWLDDLRPAVAAAAADSLGMMHAGPSEPRWWSRRQMLLSEPPIRVASVRPGNAKVMDEALQRGLAFRLVGSQPRAVREALERAVEGRRPPGVTLAAWAVFFVGPDGRIIPPPADAPAMPLSVRGALDQRSAGPIVVQFTADEPAVVGVTVSHSWSVLDRAFPAAGDIRTMIGPQAEGWPRLPPDGPALLSHKSRSDFWSSNSLRRAGSVHWPRLLISPERPAGRSQSPVGSEARDASWWSTLSRAETGWVATGDVVERFLCVDAPVGGSSSVHINGEADGLTITRASLFDVEGLLVRRQGKDLEVRSIQVLAHDRVFSTRYSLRSMPLVKGDPAEALAALLKIGGLLPAESGALIDVWRPWLLERDGCRVLWISAPSVRPFHGDFFPAVHPVQRDSCASVALYVRELAPPFPDAAPRR